MLNTNLKMRKIDVRTIKTKNKIKKHFISLLKNKYIQNITISELTKNCSLNRNTFYLHYDTLNDLFDSIKNEVFFLFLNPISKFELEEIAYNPDIIISLYLSILSENEYARNFVFYTKYSDDIINELNNKISLSLFDRYKKIIYSNDKKYLVNILFVFYGFFYTYKDLYLSGSLNIDIFNERISLLLNKGLYKTYRNTLYR